VRLELLEEPGLAEGQLARLGVDVKRAALVAERRWGVGYCCCCWITVGGGRVRCKGIGIPVEDCVGDGVDLEETGEGETAGSGAQNGDWGKIASRHGRPGV
jgi:hypothetical protein